MVYHYILKMSSTLLTDSFKHSVHHIPTAPRPRYPRPSIQPADLISFLYPGVNRSSPIHYTITVSSQSLNQSHLGVQQVVWSIGDCDYSIIESPGGRGRPRNSWRTSWEPVGSCWFMIVLSGVLVIYGHDWDSLFWEWGYDWIFCVEWWVEEFLWKEFWIL